MADDYNWQLCLESTEGEDIKIALAPGEMAIYRGLELDHWREKFDVPESCWYMQVFLHWVRKDGIQGPPHTGAVNKDYYWFNRPTPIEYRNYYAKNWFDILYRPGAWNHVNKEQAIEEYNMNLGFAGANFDKNKYNQTTTENKK